VTSPTGNLVATNQTLTSDGGDFVFDQVPLGEGDIYAFSVEYAQAFYGASFTLSQLQEKVVLTVYEPTEDVSVVTTTTHVQVIGGFDSKNRQISAIEFVLLSNNSDRTLIPNLSNPQQPSFLRFALPPMADDLEVGSDLPQGDIVPIDTGFAQLSVAGSSWISCLPRVRNANA